MYVKYRGRKTHVETFPPPLMLLMLPLQLQLEQLDFYAMQRGGVEAISLLAATFYADVASARLTMPFLNTFNQQ